MNREHLTCFLSIPVAEAVFWLTGILVKQVFLPFSAMDTTQANIMKLFNQAKASKTAPVALAEACHLHTCYYDTRTLRLGACMHRCVPRIAFRAMFFMNH